MNKKLYTLFLVFILFLTGPIQSLSQLSPSVDSIPMSDGRKLAADIYKPTSISKGPVLLIQTPYNRLLYRFGLPLQIGLNINNSNYIFVIVDWRGFYGSSSAAHAGSPTMGDDGYNVVEWISAQSWSNGKIGTCGASALGRVQFQTAAKNPPHLTCICPTVAAPTYEYKEYFPHGALRTEYVQQLDALGFGISPVLMAHTVHDIAWTFAENSNNYPDSIRVPCFMIGGWYDHTIEFMLEFFNEIRTQSPTAVRDQHRLLMGPWVHGGSGIASVGSATQGELSYPNAAKWNDSLALIYFDYQLRGINNNWNATPFVQYYQMGENTWQSSATWPPAGTSPTSFYFHKSGLMDNSLPSNSTDLQSFDYIPNNPSPTIGGTTLKKGLKQGPYNQADSVENRNDLLIYSTNALAKNVVMKGSAVVHLKVSPNRKDTDFGIRLTDVYPDGRSILVNDGILRMRMRNGNNATDTAAMIPGTMYDAVIELPNTAITFLAGHKIRIDITSSNYPRFNRNMNNGAPMYPGNSMDSLLNPLTATNTVYCNNLAVSYISLPLLGYTAGINPENDFAETISVSPNPTDNFLNIISNEVILSCSIINELGMVVYQTDGQGREETSLDFTSLTNGIYFIELKTSNMVTTRKVIVKH